MAGTFTSVPGSHSFDLTVHGHRQVTPVAGNDTVASGAHSTKVTLGFGHDTIAPLGPTRNVLGRTALAMSVTTHATEKSQGNAALGKMTLLGSAGREFSPGGAMSGLAKDAKVVTRVSPATGHDTMLGSKGADTLGFLKGPQGSAYLIQDFVAGQNKLHLPGSSLDLLKSAPESSVSSHGGNTYISLDGGKTTIELHGVAHLKAGIDPNRH